VAYTSSTCFGASTCQCLQGAPTCSHLLLSGSCPASYLGTSVLTLRNMPCHENTKNRRFHGWTNPVLITHCIPSIIPMNKMTLLNLLCDILLAHHVTQSHIAVFYADLPTLSQSLYLYAIPHAGSTTMQCQDLLLHITTRACANHL
jgi:hypothetical protein